VQKVGRVEVTFVWHHVTSEMGRLSISNRKRVIILWCSGYSLSDIRRRLNDEEIEITLRSLQYFVAKFMKFHTIKDLPKAHRPRLLNNDMINAIEDSLRSDDELTARKLKETLARVFPNLPNVSISTMKRYRKKLGWVCTCPHYCQLVKEANKEKRKLGVKLRLTTRRRLKMSSVQMNAPSNWIAMAVFVSAKKRRVEHLNSIQNILLKFTSGVGYQCEGQLSW